MLYGGKRKQSDTGHALYFVMIDASDHLTGKTGLTPTVTLSKDGASYGSPSGAVSEIANGLYKVAGNATDSGTLGPLFLHATATGADPTDIAYEIVNYDPFTFCPDANMTKLAGTSQTAGADLGTIAPAIKTQTDKMAFTVANKIDANALLVNGATPDSDQDIADAILKRDWTAVTGEAARSMLNALRFLRNKWTLTGTTLSVKKEDDSTEAWAGTVTTDGAAQPITGNDPS